MSRARQMWGELVKPSSPPDGVETLPGREAAASRLDRVLDASACLLAIVLGALFLSPDLHDQVVPLGPSQVAMDVSCGLMASILLWWRRRWPLGVALVCVLLGMFSSSATPAGLLAVASLAVRRPVREVLLVVVVWVPSAVVFAAYSPTTDTLSVVLVSTPIAMAAAGWGMFLRARRQLLLSLRERALRAEADQHLHEEQARMAERTRIAREMHDVLAHRISLLALHAGALEIRPDLRPETVRATAGLMRSTARQALEELRGVIGVLREQQGSDDGPPAPQPTLSDIGRLVEETRRAGAKIDFDLRVDQADAVPGALGRDAYRIVQEALTNVGKHASGTATWVRITGAPSDGLHVTVRNRRPLRAQAGPTLPGSGTGLLGLQERVALAGGTLVHGPDRSGDFVVDAELRW